MPHYITQTGLAFINELAIRRVGRVAQDPKPKVTPPGGGDGRVRIPDPTAPIGYRADGTSTAGPPKVTPTSPGARGGTSGPQLPTMGPQIDPDRFTRRPSVAARLKAWDDAHPAKPVMPDARVPGPGSAGPPSPVVRKRPEMYSGARSTADLDPPRHLDLKGNVVPDDEKLSRHQNYRDVKFKYARNKYKDEREAKEAQAAKEAEELSASRMGRLSPRVGRGMPVSHRADRTLSAKERMNLRLKATGRPAMGPAID